MRLLLDVDGVLAAWAEAVVAVIKDASGREIKPADCGGWMQLDKLGLTKTEHKYVNDVLNSRGFTESLEVLPGAGEFVYAARDLGFEICYLTAPWVACETWTYERRQWLKKHDFLKSKDALIFAAGHHKCYVRGDALVDDKLENVEEWARVNEGRLAVHWQTCWSLGQTATGSITSIGKWAELLKELKQCKSRLT